MGEKPGLKTWERMFIVLMLVAGALAFVGGIIGLVNGLDDSMETEDAIGTGNLFLIGAALMILAYARRKPEAKSAKLLTYLAVVLIWAVVGMMLAVVLLA